ncbi:hypothetical protein OG563_26675 [Nocardia vinacea]|uniref:Uncharacterized protein n=1 Tax=Nocardia vinacea TaxID=96468 RepID=A0ABZ1YLH0_9NOCA|nr:hypothetical protein [Nocardia vinacea]
MAFVVIHEGPGGELFVHAADTEDAAEEFREECGGGDEPTSAPVEMSDEIDWNALEEVLPFLDTVEEFFNAMSGSAERAARWVGFPEGFSQRALRRLEPDLEEIVLAIDEFEEREVYKP